jgi:hypothetical protein
MRAGSDAMPVNWGEFEDIVVQILERYLAQNSKVPSKADLSRLAHRLGEAVKERGLPRPLRPDERGVPGGMAEQECAQQVARVAGETSEPLLIEAVRQLVKACSYPEFKDCRDSFREVARDGACRRQELVRVKGRVSGSHCVDCPHWVDLESHAHQEFLAAEWKLGVADFVAHRSVFLPEDFRGLRRWLHAASRATV